MLLTSQHSSSDPDYAVGLVDDCLKAAIEHRASDLHLQPREACWEVCFRIDGVLHSAGSFERSQENDPVSRLMAMASLPSYRSGVPQEGPLRWTDDRGTLHEMRLGIYPTVHGNRAAIRVMRDREAINQLEQLGFTAELQTQLVEACENRDGWILVAGPAGSGKTTTLYACLSHIAQGSFQRNVLSIEDPIESIIETISQSQVNHGGGMTLASALRAAVRQDAEVLLVSEIRDVETAEAVLSASMTGHLCFSSIHSGSIGSTLRRLVQMNLPTFAIESGLRGILCQRLLRKTCVQCRSAPTSTADPQCLRCRGMGYSGRFPIAQMISFDTSIESQAVFEALSAGRSASQIDALLESQGIASLETLAMRAVSAGQTDKAEVARVIGSGR